jgi:hypothetical protein
VGIIKKVVIPCVSAVALLGIQQAYRAQQDRGRPAAVTPTPQTYRISGVRRDTRQDVTIDVQAESPENARVKAELDGVTVTKIER